MAGTVDFYESGARIIAERSGLKAAVFWLLDIIRRMAHILSDMFASGQDKYRADKNLGAAQRTLDRIDPDER